SVVVMQKKLFGEDMEMKIFLRALLIISAACILAFNTQAQERIVIQDRFASLDDVRLHYLFAGKGEPVVLLHGYAQNSRMWRPLIRELAKTRQVMATALRGFGQTSKPANGYEKKTMAQNIHKLVASLGFKQVSV